MKVKLLMPLLATLVATGAALLTVGGTASAAPAHVGGAQSVTANSPSHQGARVCSSNYCYYAYIDGAADSTHVAASATAVITSTPSPVARLQVDALYIGTDTTPNRAHSAGPVNSGSQAPATATASTSIVGAACEIFQAHALVSATLSNGTVLRGQVTSLPFTSTDSACPQVPTTQYFHNGACKAGAVPASCVTTSIQAVLPPNKKTAFAIGSLSLPSRTATGISGARIMNIRVTYNGSSVGTPFSLAYVDSMPNQSVQVTLRSYGLTITPGCHIYTVAMTYILGRSQSTLPLYTASGQTQLCG